ncbi:MAG: family 1 glycosylhydrolase [Actinomycetales bacterium]|nr:family 1 glycosylhydrolase [Actinomycetales bacterium]
MTSTDPWFRDGRLRFALGVEDTFIPQTRAGEKPLDEYDLTQHSHFWAEDLGRAAQVGADFVRWGVPWYRVNPEKGIWDFSWIDRVVDRFDELELGMIVDLMHYGTPTWLENEFANHDYPKAVAEYASRFAERYRGRVRDFTPLNEPMLNVIHCGEFGYWPPYLRGHDGLVKLARAISQGIVLTQDAVREATGGEANFVHVEASFRFAGDVEAFRDRVEHLRHRAYLIEDLVTGKVDAEHPLAGYLAENGFGDDDLQWALENTAWPDVMGVNYYPKISTELFERDASHTGGPEDIRPRVNSWTEGLEEVLSDYATRYGRPVFLTETCWTGTPEERIAWLDSSVESVRGLRDRGVDVVGYTWWGVIDMYEWTYRHGTRPLRDYLLPMGLWDLVEDAAGVLQRVENPVAERYRAYATGER